MNEVGASQRDAGGARLVLRRRDGPGAAHGGHQGLRPLCSGHLQSDKRESMWADGRACLPQPTCFGETTSVLVTLVLPRKGPGAPVRQGWEADVEKRTLGSLPQAHCMWDSALRGLGSGVRSSSSESLLGDVSPPDEILQGARPQRPPSQPDAHHCPPQPGKKYLQHIFMPVLDPE